MTRKYAREPIQGKKAVKTQAKDMRVHYKNTYETASAIRGKNLKVAIKYMKDVLEHKRCVPFNRHTGCIGRTAQAKEFKKTQGRWPQKSVKIILGLLENLEANANVKGLDVDKLVLGHVQVNQAQKGRRRTYRAHGRINPYLNHPCHIEMWAYEKEEDVKKPAFKGKSGAVVKLSRKQLAKDKLKIGAQIQFGQT